MQPYIKRSGYTDSILAYRDTDFIKILTGIRRSGKSSILNLLFNEFELNNNGSALLINFESFEYSSIRTFSELHNLLSSKITPDTRYILLDEIQHIDGWERVVNGLHATKQYDIYITGSNSKLLSGELSTFLAGRYKSFHIQTLGFSEFLNFYPSGNFDDYMSRGGFPAIVLSNLGEVESASLVQDIYNSVLLKDTVERHNIRNVDLLNRIITFVIDSIGSTFSAKGIANFLKSQYRNVAVETVYDYLSHLEDAFIISRVQRYDVRGKGLLKTLEKFYLADHSFINATCGFSKKFVSGKLENIVYNELARRDWKVSVGKYDTLEIDFIAKKQDIQQYIQVAYLMSEDETFERELTVLKKLKNNHRKLILTLDETRLGNYEGIECVSLSKWLLDVE
jgi:predicted AAA+ superfamily ATPase